MISIIIPTLNEEDGIAKVIRSIPQEIMKKSELIVVDSSTDKTPFIAQSLGAKVVKAKEGGKGRQMRLGAQLARGDILVFLDGDGSHSGEYIPDLLKELKSVNLVLGCRFLKNFDKDDKSFLKIIFKTYDSFMTYLFHLINFKVSADPLSGFRAIRKDDWNRLNLESDDFRIETEMNFKALKAGFIIKEVAIPYLKRCGRELTGSKLLRSPKQIFQIHMLIFKYIKESKITLKNSFEYKK